MPLQKDNKVTQQISDGPYSTRRNTSIKLWVVEWGVAQISQLLRTKRVISFTWTNEVPSTNKSIGMKSNYYFIVPSLRHL